MPTRVVACIGTRPEAVKMAPVIHALRDAGWARVRVLATAQHRELLDQILAFFAIEADRDLDLMRADQSLVDLTSRMLTALDAALGEERPDFVLAQGDTTTVMVAALCCYYRRIPFGHVEAGLRTGVKYEPFPEEMNRALVARLADLHFAPTEGARRHLAAEGVPADAVAVTGNTVIDALLWGIERVDASRFLPAAGHRQILVTAHRRENFGPPLEEICGALLDLAARGDVEILYPVHPNPNVVAVTERLLRGRARIRLVPPLDYPDFLAAMKSCDLILTDSGGVQEEAPALGKPVLVLRERTERPEGIEAGTACLVGPRRRAIVAKANELLDDARAYTAMARAANPYGDGRAAGRICEAVRTFLGAAPPAFARR